MRIKSDLISIRILKSDLILDYFQNKSGRNVLNGVHL